jgi:uncharacterized protein YndB with AHSA1/START domain
MSTEKPGLVLTRLIDAPRERVWKAWTLTVIVHKRSVNQQFV